MDRYVCDRCGASFAASEDYDRHVLEKHSEERVLPEQMVDSAIARGPTGTQISSHGGSTPPTGTGGVTTP